MTSRSTLCALIALALALATTASAQRAPFAIPDPDLETANPGFTSDIKEIHVHGPMTHLDALCHDSYKGRWYNGYVLAQYARHALITY